MKRLIKNGRLVDEKGEYQEELLINEGKIIQRGQHLPLDSETEVIDASNLLIMPGGIDVHTHFNIKTVTRSCDDFFSGTRAAACGGTTTIVDHMGFGPAGCDLHHQLKEYHRYAAGKAVIDYSFHGVVQHINDEILEEMHSMVHEEGISSFKLYLTYQYKLDDKSVLQALKRLKEVQALTTVHPENDAVIHWNIDRFKQQGKVAPIWHARSRPAACEAEAISRVINLAKLAGNAPLYIVHLSNGLGLEYLKIARQSGQPVWIETCPQYLLLDSQLYLQPDGLKYILSPPLRSPIEQDKLWVGIDDGLVDVIATDHCTFPYWQRQAMASNDFSLCPNGLPGVENRMPLFFSEAVTKGRISASRFVSLTSSMPAKLFGLWPEKGNLNVESDADLVLFDPQKTFTIQHEQLHDNCDYSPYEGFTGKGAVAMTISRGEIVYQNGQFTGQAGHGKFVFRKPFDSKE